MHAPGLIEHPRIPIYLARVGPLTYRLAGDLADGVHVNSFHTVDYLREVSLPALTSGLERSGRARGDLTLSCSLFSVIDADPAMDRAVRSQNAFYGSPSAYRPIFDLHGCFYSLQGMTAPAAAGAIAAAFGRAHPAARQA